MSPTVPMEAELEATTSFLSSYLPKPASAGFDTKLSSLLARRYAQHWHQGEPERGSAYRAIVRSGPAKDQIDDVLVQAGRSAGLSLDALDAALKGNLGSNDLMLGDRWTLWVDPGCVSLRIENGQFHGYPSGPTTSTTNQFIQLLGQLPAELQDRAATLGSLNQPFTLAVPASPVKASTGLGSIDYSMLSPTKRASKAIQILAPSSRSVSASIQPSSPIAMLTRSASPPSSELVHPTLLASPMVIPPTPLRPTTAGDIFSPTPAVPVAASAQPAPPTQSNLAMTAPTLAPGMLMGPPPFRRTVSRGSSAASSTGRTGRSVSSTSYSSQANSDYDDELFSSAESVSSSVASAATLWPKHNPPVVMDGEFKYPPMPVRPTSAQSGSYPSMPFGIPPRSHSSASNHAPIVYGPGFVPPSPSHSLGGRSQPGSPSKPRRRGTRGGQSAHNHMASVGSVHAERARNRGASASISSISSVASSVAIDIPAARDSATLAPGSASGSVAGSASSSRTREQALQGNLTEHSGGKVVVLGGGVLLGLAGTKAPSSARAEVEGEPKHNRRGRESRRRGGRRMLDQQMQQPQHIFGQPPMGVPMGMPMQQQYMPYQPMPPMRQGWEH